MAENNATAEEVAEIRRLASDQALVKTTRTVSGFWSCLHIPIISTQDHYQCDMYVPFVASRHLTTRLALLSWLCLPRYQEVISGLPTQTGRLAVRAEKGSFPMI
jgi:hypothetical protein